LFFGPPAAGSDPGVFGLRHSTTAKLHARPAFTGKLT